LRCAFSIALVTHRGEDTHQVVLERQVEARRARITLATRAAAQLVVDAPRFVTLGTDHMQAAGGEHLLVARRPRLAHRGARRVVGLGAEFGELCLEVATEHDVGAAAGHVGGDGDPTGASGLGHDLRLALVLFGVQYLVRDAVLLELLRQVLGGLDRHGADQHRLAALVAVPDVLDDGVELLGLGQVDQVAVVGADHRHVGRDHHHLESVDGLEFVRLGVGRAGHAGQLVVEAEVVLEGDRGQRLVLVLDRHPLLRLDRLVQATRPAAPGQRAPGELVDDHHLAVLDDVLDVALEQRVGADRRVDEVHQLDVRRVVEALALGQQAGPGQQFLDVLVAWWPSSVR
jgi:hypothetical protein